MKKYFRKNIKSFILSVTFSLFVALSNILLSYSMGFFTNSAIKRNVNDVFLWSVITLAALILTNIFQSQEINFRTKYSKKMALDLKEDVYKKLTSKKYIIFKYRKL